jgi:Domain of unknown function (DUF3291)
MHLAQVNVGITVAPMDSAAMAEFAAALDPINAVADTAPGFLWRLQDDSGNATSIRGLSDERLLLNLSVWDGIESLSDYVYRSAHTAFLRRRREWFVPMTDAITCLWWVPAGHRPSVAEADDRLAGLRAHGPTARAFTFRSPFPPPIGADVRPIGADVRADAVRSAGQ